MNKLSEDFEYALSKFGAPILGERAPPALFDKYQGRLPKSLLEFWEFAGFGVWLEGYFQFCNPDRYRPIVEMVLGNDLQLKAEFSHIIGFSAFGRALVWNENYRVADIDMLYHNVLCSELFKPNPKISDEINIGVAISSVDDEANDPPDESGRDMYKRVFKAHGPLKFGQIYAPKLHPALGGPVTVDNFRPASALEALALSAQAGPFTLRNATSFPVRDVRQLG